MEAKCGGETNIPPKGNTIYQWPSDLLKPTAVLFLDLCESDRLKRMKTRGEIETNEELQLRNSQLLRQRQVFKKVRYTDHMHMDRQNNKMGQQKMK